MGASCEAGPGRIVTSKPRREGGEDGGPGVEVVVDDEDEGRRALGDRRDQGALLAWENCIRARRVPCDAAHTSATACYRPPAPGSISRDDRSMSTRPLHELRDEARSARARGDLARAQGALFAALQHTVAREEDYVGATAELRDVLAAGRRLPGGAHPRLVRRQRAHRSAQLVAARPAHRPGPHATSPGPIATPTATGPAASTPRPPTSTRPAGLVAQAAIAGERGGDFARARALWSRLSHLLSSSGADLYAAGLARFNLARTSLRTGDAAAAREAVVAAVHLLEEAADRYETIGQRERAFDCYQVLIAVGRESQRVRARARGLRERDPHPARGSPALLRAPVVRGGGRRRREAGRGLGRGDAGARDVRLRAQGGARRGVELRHAHPGAPLARGGRRLAQAPRAARRSPRTRCSPR